MALIISALQDANKNLILPVAKREEFIEGVNRVFLQVDDVGDVLKVTGHVGLVAHLLEHDNVGAEEVNATAYERAHFTIPKPSTEAELKEKVRTVKAIADFWGFVFQTNIDVA